LSDGRAEPGNARAGELLEGLLPNNGCLGVIAPSGVGKTFLGVDLALHYAHGMPWFGRAWGWSLHKGRVLYCLSEGHAQFNARVEGWRKVHPEARMPQGADFMVYRGSLGLLNDKGAKLKAVLDQLDEQGRLPGLIAYDTLSGHFGDGDPVSDGDALRWVNILQGVHQQYGCAGFVPHHTGLKDTSRGYGSAALNRVSDTELLLQKRPDGLIVVKNTKRRDRALIPPFGARLRVVDLGYNDPFGKPATTCVFEPAPLTPEAAKADSAGPNKAHLTPTERKAMDALKRLASGKERRPDGGVELSASSARNAMSEAGLSRQTASKVRKALEGCGLLTAAEGDVLVFREVA
jgi:hypothetical protein